jgi:hypothetical protein
MKRNLQCIAHGHDGAWEAICLDLDIAVSGRSYDEVKMLLNQSIHSYIEDARNEDAATKRALLTRRAPWHVRIHHAFRYAIATLSGRRYSEEEHAGFHVPCHA